MINNIAKENFIKKRGDYRRDVTSVYLFIYINLDMFEILRKTKLHVICIIYEYLHTQADESRINIKTAARL